MSPPNEPDPLSGRFVALVLAALSVGRLALAPAFDLTPQEAYYFLYAEHPALSYLDHAPMIGWLLYLSAALLGKTVIAVRAVPLVTTLLLQLTLWALLREILPRARQASGWLLFLTLPMTTGLSLMAVPDGPMAMFWGLTLLLLHRAIFRGSRWSWLAAGLAMGLAFDSKYFAVFLPAGLLLFLAISRAHRPLLRTPWPWIALLLSQAASLPVYVWNLQHELASFRYQSVYRLEHGFRIEPASTLALLLHQSTLVGPVMFAGLLAACWRQARRLVDRSRSIEPGALFLLCFTLPLLLTCLGASLAFWVKMNWLLPVYMAGVPLVALGAGRRLFRWQLIWVALFHVVLVVELVLYPWPIRGDDTWYGWRQLARQVEERALRHPEAFLFSLDSYKTAAELRFYTDRRVWGLNVVGYHAYQLDYIGEDPRDLVGRAGLLIDSEGASSYPEELRLAFDSVLELEPIEITRRGEVVRRFQVLLCSGYRGPPAPDELPRPTSRPRPAGRPRSAAAQAS